jgi:hypothetical protein
LSWWFSEKKPSQNGWVQIDLSKMALLVKLDMGAEKTHAGFFLLKFPIKKVGISCNEFRARGL